MGEVALPAVGYSTLFTPAERDSRTLSAPWRTEPRDQIEAARWPQLRCIERQKELEPKPQLDLVCAVPLRRLILKGGQATSA
jgi:hypothetical protein